VGAALWVHGWGALARLALAAGAAVLFELVVARLMRQKVRVGDLSALGQGLLLALLLPPTAPWWLLLLGVAVALFVGKLIFGGTGGYPLHPVLVGWAVLLLSWGNRVYPVDGALLGTAWTPAVWIGGLALLLLGHLRWQAPVGMIVGVGLTAAALRQVYPDVPVPLEQLGQGVLVLGAFFLATDPTVTPANAWPRLLYGLLAGALVVVLRHFGTWPEPVPFALLLTSLMTPLLDRLRPRPARRVTSHA
jgi:electron transport complex protein RnfD